MAWLAVLAACVWPPASAARAADWEWMITPYLWASGVSLDLTANDEPVIGSDVTFSDLLDKTDFAGEVHFEGRRGKAGFFADALYTSLSEGVTTPANPPLPGGTRVESELDMGLYEGGGFYRLIAGDGRALDLLFGARLLDLELENDVALPSPSTATTTLDLSESLLDGFAGLRYGHALGKRWDFVIRADAGAGDTDLTWNAVGTVGVRFGQTDRYSLRVGWRHTEIELDQESDGGVDLETDLTLSGPAIAFMFKF
jgi:hypothetical protein